MTALKRELDLLTNLMKQQECYKKYREALKTVQKDEALYAKLNEYREKNVELHYNKQTLQEEAFLEKKYHDFLMDERIHEFLHWEQETLKMLRLIHKEIGEALVLDYSFLS